MPDATPQSKPPGSGTPQTYDASRKGRSPDDRSTAPDPAVTNHDHPVSAGSGVVAAPGVGAIDDDAAKPSAVPPATRGPAHAATTSGVNRVEDQSSKASPRLSVPSDDAGPGPSANTPELQDPNYTAATERAKQ